MEWSKIKNIILIILLAANLFLLSLVAVQETHSRRYQNNLMQNALGVLDKNGIAVNLPQLPKDTDLARLTMERDRDKEAKAASALLGQADASQQGAATLYTGTKGTALFSRSGEFSAAFGRGAWPLDGLTEREHALRTLELIGFEGEVTSTEVKDGQTALTVRQSWQGIPVFTCRAVLVYGEQEMRAVKRGSCRLTGNPQPSGETETLFVAAALLHFLEGLRDLGDVCTELTGLTAGYAFAPGISDPVTLRPVWHITTDTGIYFLDARAGVLERAD